MKRSRVHIQDSLLTALHQEVIWANEMEGGHVRGRDGVRSYWTRQWAIIDPHVDPVEFSRGAEGEIIVEVHQVVHDVDGKLLVDKMVRHVFRIENGLAELLTSAPRKELNRFSRSTTHRV